MPSKVFEAQAVLLVRTLPYVAALLQAKQPEKYRTMIHELETLLPNGRNQD
jgi:hypothetical protein